jgi:hypothetical protein
MSETQGSARRGSGGAGAHWPDNVRLPISISMMWEAGSEPMPMIPAQAVPTEAAGKRFPNFAAYTEEQYG